MKNINFHKSQLMRGTIEGCILQIISAYPTYGYDIVLRLHQYGFKEIQEGTIYPLLLRLEKKGILDAKFQPSPLGPARKYYNLTKEGESLLESFRESWREVAKAVESVLDEG